MHHYPAPRERCPAPEAVLTDRFRPPETTSGYISLGTALAEIWRFSPHVARIKALVLDNDAILVLHKRGDRANYDVNIPAGAEWDEGVAAEIVEGRNRIAGAVARVQLQGYYT